MAGPAWVGRVLEAGGLRRRRRIREFARDREMVDYFATAKDSRAGWKRGLFAESPS